MSSCDDFEVAIEKRRHGALEADETTKLEVHLASCLSCRTYEQRGTEMEATMKAAFRGEAPMMGFDELKTHFRAFGPQTVDMLRIAALMFAMTLGFGGVSLPVSLVQWVVVVAVGLLSGCC